MILTKKEMVYEAIKETILQGELKPGEKLTISKIAKSHDVSEIPVREALQQIEAEGLIVNKPHSGYRVVPMSEKEISEIFEIRANLEGLATRLAVPNLSPKAIQQLEDLVLQEKAFIANDEFKLFRANNMAFHKLIYQHCGNEKLFKMIFDLWDNTKRYPSLFEYKPNLESSHQEHQMLLDAIKSGDSARAEQIEIIHKRRALKAILELVNKENVE